MEQNRIPKGIRTAGQFAATAHDEAGVTLTSPARALPELAPYGEIPAPLESQTLEDGSPAGATFEESYRSFFRELDEHEAVRGPYETQQSISEAGILDLAGIGDADLGRHRGTFLERDEDTGEPVIVVHTRNGGGNRECYNDPCDGNCTGCIQTDAIPALPTYLRDEDDEDDCTYANNYFRPVDAAAGLAAVQDQEQRNRLNQLEYYRNAISEGKQPPWAVLSPIRGSDERESVRRDTAVARQDSGRQIQRRRIADAVVTAVENGTEMPNTAMMRVPDEMWTYGVSLKSKARHDSAAREAREAADALASEMDGTLPHVVAELASREFEKLDREAHKREAEATDNQDKITAAGVVMKRWAGIVHLDADTAEAASAAAETKLKDFDWSASFPGDVQECPPRPDES